MINLKIGKLVNTPSEIAAQLGIKDTVTAILFRGKKSLCLYLPSQQEAQWPWHGWDLLQKAVLRFHAGDQDLRDTKAEPHWGLAPCWEAVRNDRGAQCFKNSN